MISYTYGSHVHVTALLIWESCSCDSLVHMTVIKRDDQLTNYQLPLQFSRHVPCKQSSIVSRILKSGTDRCTAWAGSQSFDLGLRYSVLPSGRDMLVLNTVRHLCSPIRDYCKVLYYKLTLRGRAHYRCVFIRWFYFFWNNLNICDLCIYVMIVVSMDNTAFLEWRLKPRYIAL